MTFDDALRSAVRDAVRDVIRDELPAIMREVVESAAEERPMRSGGYLSVREAAKQMGASPESVYKWVHQGRLRARYAGKRLRIRSTDVEAFMTRDITPGVSDTQLDAKVLSILQR